MYILVVGADTLRAIAGPLPTGFCKIKVFIQMFIKMKQSLLLLATTLTKFALIIIYGSMPVMDDAFLFFIINATISTAHTIFSLTNINPR